MLTFSVYKDARGEWRWRLKHRNGNIIADGSEGYVNKADALNGISLVKSTTQSTPIAYV